MLPKFPPNLFSSCVRILGIQNNLPCGNHQEEKEVKKESQTIRISKLVWVPVDKNSIKHQLYLSNYWDMVFIEELQ